MTASATLALQLVANGLVVGGLLGLVALGLALIFGVMRVVNFAHGEFITLGAYITWLIAGGLGLSPFVGIPAAFLTGAVLGWIIQTLLISRVMERPPLDALMVTYSLSILGLGLFSFFFGGDFRSYSEGPSGDFHLGAITVGARSLSVLLVCLFLAAAAILLLRSARLGLAFRALAQNRDAAASSGINIRFIERLAFGLAVGLAAVAGSLISLVGTTTPTVGNDWILEGFVVVVVGGMGSIPGAIVAALLIGLVQSVFGYLFDDSWAKIITYLILYMTLLVRPQGLLGRATEMG
jgi:branched-chain amino acid transport system permease protein